MTKVDSTTTAKGQLALRIWGSSDPESAPQGSFATLLEWDRLLEETDRAIRESVRRRSRA